MDEEMMLLEVDEHMGKAVEWMTTEFTAVRTGKASPALVENIDIHVESYGSAMKLKQLAMITTPEPRMLMVQPFDPSTVQEIERGLRESKLGINPAVDGKIIRLPIPELSEERRRDMVKPLYTPRGLAGDMRASLARGAARSQDHPPHGRGRRRDGSPARALRRLSLASSFTDESPLHATMNMHKQNINDN